MPKTLPAPAFTVSTPWPADRVQRRRVEDLIPYARNARTHSDAQIAQISASIERFGFTVPVLVGDDGTIIAGHGRVLAAKKLGLVEVPVMVADGWSDEMRRAYTLADNKLTENGGWDDELLRLELGWLQGAGFDLGLVGFSEHEVDVALNGWTANAEKTNVEADLAEMPATIKVRCFAKDKDAVEAAILDALSALKADGIEGLDVA